MTVMQEPPTLRTPPRPPLEPWWRLPEIWGTAAIIMMWLAVLFVSVYGGDMSFHSTDGSFSTIPVGGLVAICAAIASAVVARRIFRT